VVPGALMIEPTETESRETLDAFVAAMETIYTEALNDPDLVKRAPHKLALKRVDEAEAARHPILRWTPKNQE
jgi:glycine dehydrogenase subunit 2